MGKKFLIDTNVVIDFAAKKLPKEGHAFVAKVIDSQPYISVINKIELLAFTNVPEKIISFVQNVEVLPLSDTVALQTIVIRKTKKIKIPDAVIAATAIENNLTLLTRNTKDFEKTKNLSLLNPYQINS